MVKKSAGLLMYRCSDQLQVLLAHPGGPFWTHKDLGSWSIPKGEYQDEENAIDAAKREFIEETGYPVYEPLLFLGELKQAGGKTVSAWAFSGDCDPGALVSNTFELEWPPRSGKVKTFPEIDRVAWFNAAEAKKRILKGQKLFIEVLEDKVCGRKGACD